MTRKAVRVAAMARHADRMNALRMIEAYHAAIVAGDDGAAAKYRDAFIRTLGKVAS